VNRKWKAGIIYVGNAKLLAKRKLKKPLRLNVSVNVSVDTGYRS
jgi:hypothetical protein